MPFVVTLLQGYILTINQFIMTIKTKK